MRIGRSSRSTNGAGSGHRSRRRSVTGARRPGRAGPSATPRRRRLRCSTVRDCRPVAAWRSSAAPTRLLASDHRLSGLGHAGQDQLRDVRVDVDGAGLARGRHAVVPIGDVVVIADLHELDRWKGLQPVHRAVDPLPAGAPVPAAQPWKRSKVGGVLGWVPHRADDPVDRDGLQPEGPARSRAGGRMDVEERAQELVLGSTAGGAGPSTPDPGGPHPAQGAGKEEQDGGGPSEEPAKHGVQEGHRHPRGAHPDRAVALRTMMPSPSTGRHGPPGLSCDYSRS